MNIAMTAITSRLQLHHQPRQHQHHQADRLLLTSGLELMVCVDRGRIVLWRLSLAAKFYAYSKYTSDDAAADDAADPESYQYDDDAGDDVQQVESTRRRTPA